MAAVGSSPVPGLMINMLYRHFAGANVLCRGLQAQDAKVGRSWHIAVILALLSGIVSYSWYIT